MPSPQRNYNEPSPSQRRALAETITSPRQLVEFKGTVQLILTCVSDNPHMHVSQSTEVMLSCGSEKRIKDLKDSFKDKKLSTKNMASFHTSRYHETWNVAPRLETWNGAPCFETWNQCNQHIASRFTLHTSRFASPHSTFFPHLLSPMWEKTNSFVRT